jgi:glyoxylase-like metal-dependent hydrolase (beta-lactamase superfamily II)
MDLHIVDAGYLMLDGGAIFGVVPKTIWQKTNPADENNLCRIAMRCLLIEDGDKLILIDTGIGNKQDEKFLKHYYLHGETDLTKAVNKTGFSVNDVTDVFLTHLHFDHVGGAVTYRDEHRNSFSITFPNATYWSNEPHWQWAVRPNAREKASFLKENISPLFDSGNLQFIDIHNPSPFPQFDILYFDGHTEKQMIPLIRYKNKSVVFAADILPTTGHIPLPYVMAYDTRPLITLFEKEKFLNSAADQEFVIYFEHDPYHECCTLKHTERGVRISNTFNLREVLS